jgi:hypothetical protein
VEPAVSPSDEPQPSVRDAYLDWAIRTGFRFIPGQVVRSTVRSVGLLIRWKSLDDAANGKKITQSYEKWATIPHIYQGSETTKIRLLWSVSIAADQVVSFLDAIEPYAARIELASPVGQLSNLQPRAARIELKSEHEVLAAVLDDGCAFANARFVSNAAGKVTPRVLWFWNQNPDAPGFPLDAVSGPSSAFTCNYGAQWSQTDLEALIQANGSEELAYAAAGLSGLRRSAAHGPHVMDLLAGGEDWPVVFVQFPQAAIDDPSGVWLRNYAVDGLHYVLQCAGPKTKTIVVNISWGPQTGPHDGTWELEAEIDRLVAEQYALGRTLIVSLPAGNSLGLRAHAQVDYFRGGAVEWSVPPDGKAAPLLEVWWPVGITPNEAQLRITPPASAPQAIVAGAPWDNDNWYASIEMVGSSTKAVVCIKPTENIDPTQSGRHGTWTVELPAGQKNAGNVDVYLARADHNMGARRRAKANFLSDDDLERSRFLRPDDGNREAPGSTIRREGTLNGLATGADGKVAAGYRLSDLRPTRYSSSGGTRGTRNGPDYACLTDISEAVRGMRATGVRSGTSVRLVGTSMAAPQLGRQLAKKYLVPFLPFPALPNQTRRIGTACLWPEDGVVHKGYEK